MELRFVHTWPRKLGGALSLLGLLGVGVALWRRLDRSVKAVDAPRRVTNHLWRTRTA